jgi:AraC-like DNA-binding protein
VIKGKLLCTVEGHEYRLSDGDIIMANPDELHSLSFPEKCEYQREFLHIYPGFLEKFEGITRVLDERAAGCFNQIPAELVKKYGLDKIFNNINEYCSAKLPETHFMVMTYATQLVVKISRILTDEKIEYSNAISNKRVSRIYKFIDRHYTENITLEDIAEGAMMSTFYASRIFKKETGMNIKTYINMRRIIAAKNLIYDGRKTTDVFEECGFCNYSTFYRAFIKFVGITPNEFKNIGDGIV